MNTPPIEAEDIDPADGTCAHTAAPPVSDVLASMGRELCRQCGGCGVFYAENFRGRFDETKCPHCRGAGSLRIERQKKTPG